MKQLILLILIFIDILFSSCSQKNRESKTAEYNSNSISDTIKKSINAIENGKEQDRKFVRTADLKFRVNDVSKVSSTIENIIKKENGFIVYTKLFSDVDNTEITEVSKDSSIETIYFTVSNTITLRVPAARFDTTLKEIAAWIDFLDYRIIKADDVSFQLLTNNLTLKRAASNTKKNTHSEVADSYNQEQADNAKVSNLTINDQLKYCTINLIFSQRQSPKRSVISNNKNIDAYSPGFGSKIVSAIIAGWSWLESLILFFIQSWAVILLVIALYFLFRKFRNRIKK